MGLSSIAGSRSENETESTVWVQDEVSLRPTGQGDQFPGRPE